MSACLIGLMVGYQQFVSNSLALREPPGEKQVQEKMGKSEIVQSTFVPMTTPPSPLIDIGVLHSLTGPMASSDGPIVDAVLFAVDEINSAGGILGGRQINPIIRDGKSFENEFGQQALQLVRDEKIVYLFGVWRSSCRRRVEAVCKDYEYLLIYPTNYEGLEECPNVMYLGGTANQQVIPGIRYAYSELGKRRFFLVGSDGLFLAASTRSLRMKQHPLEPRLLVMNFFPWEMSISRIS